LIDGIPADWRVALADAIDDPSFQRLTGFLAMERARTDTAIYPPDSRVFEALRLTPLDTVRAVILGQDPYHGEGQAPGLAFSVPAGVPIPPSLRNIRAEWMADTEQRLPTSGSLEAWARHGVLLLNTVLTVRRGEANSHHDQGWEPFTDAVIRAVNGKADPVVFLLWGRHAQLQPLVEPQFRHL
jgi:uracil-DNA glycosylase